MINYRTGNLFKAPEGSALIHACNARGVWGGGIAAQFAERFPAAYTDYARYCRTAAPADLVGTCRVYRGADYWIVSLITSRGFGFEKDSPAQILKHTGEAVTTLLQEKRLPPEVELHSPRINAGLFNVPWDDTSRVLEDALKPFSKDWYVWTPASQP